MMLLPRRACLLLAACLSPALNAQVPAQPATVAPAADTANPSRSLTRAAQPGGVAISPDGATLAWTLRRGEITSLHLTDVAHPDPATEKIIAPGSATDCSNESPIWSPDGQTLAFLSTCTSSSDRPGHQQVFLWSRVTGAVRQLTHVTGNIAQPAWSPDGRAIAFLFVENATRSAGALDAMKPWAGVIGEDGVEVQRVYAVNVVKGDGGWITPLTLHVYEFDWSHDSREIAYIAADPPGENNWWVAKLWAAPVDIGGNSVAEQPRIVLDPVTVAGPLHGLQIAVPRWSSDDKKIALIGGLMSDQGSTGGDLWVVDSGGGRPTDVTPKLDGTVCHESFVSANHIGFVEDRRGHTILLDWDIDAKAVVPGSALDLGEVTIGRRMEG